MLIEKTFAELGISGMDGAMTIIAVMMIVGGFLQLIATLGKKTRRSSNSDSARQSRSRGRAARAGR